MIIITEWQKVKIVSKEIKLSLQVKIGRKSKHWLITSLSLPSCHFPSTNDYQSYEIQPVFICKDRTLTKCCFNLSSHIHKDRIDISRVFSRCFEELNSPLVSDFLPNTGIVIMSNETGANVNFELEKNYLWWWLEKHLVTSWFSMPKNTLMYNYLHQLPSVSYLL